MKNQKFLHNKIFKKQSSYNKISLNLSANLKNKCKFTKVKHPSNTFIQTIRLLEFLVDICKKSAELLFPVAQMQKTA
jgi:hypothetical protein